MVKETDTMVSLPLIGDLTFREWHHFVTGVTDGYRTAEEVHRPPQQSAYWDGGYLLGSLVLRRLRP